MCVGRDRDVVDLDHDYQCLDQPPRVHEVSDSIGDERLENHEVLSAPLDLSTLEYECC